MKQNRKTLKNYFGKGKLPTESHFGDLIDSNLNMRDEGFDKSPENGFEINTLGEHEGLITFFGSDNPQQPLWSLCREVNHDELVFRNRRVDREGGLDEESGEATAKADSTLCLGAGGRVGVNKEQPAAELDVNGVVAAVGRRGTYQAGLVPADGKWQAITGELRGCHAFEVMAGVGKKKTGKYALLHATALNTHHPRGWLFNFLNLKRRIKCRQAYYRSIRDKLRLRWKELNNGYCLQIKTSSDYRDNIRIQYSLTRLWFDEDMSGCVVREDQEF